MNSKKVRKKCATFVKELWSLLLSGLFTILPLTLTITVFHFSFKLVKQWLEPIHNMLPPILLCIPHLEIILVLLFVLLIGAIMQIFVLRSLIHALESLIFKIPLIRPIYSGIRQLVHAFSPQDTLSFKRVVLVEFPKVGVYSVGFVTSQVPQELAPTHDGINYRAVFIPTTPNPTTGFFIFLPDTEIIPVDLSRQEAMALIISGGIIQPERFTRKDV
jgi:uncharacterized membrane protein